MHVNYRFSYKLIPIAIRKCELILFTFLLIFPATTALSHADDLDPHYKFSGVQAPASPYKNTWGAFQTDLFSGSFSYNYKIEVPPGTNGLAPKLSIGYNSHSAKGKAGWVGAGWDIPQSYIQRDINFTRKDTDDDKFELYLDGAKHDLVFVSGDGRYHTRVESYLKVEYKGSGAPNEKGSYWIVTAKDGTEYRFGYNLDSENMLSASDASFTKYVTRWSLDRIKDANGNCIYFTYAENPTGNDRGAVYLSKIDYNNDKKRSIEFVRETADKPDAYLTVEQGSEVREARRLGEILVKVDGSLVRKYKLAYGINGTQNRSLLSSITQYGADGTSALPPVRFEYKSLNRTFGSMLTWATPGGGKYIRKSESDGDVYYDTADMDGDGLPDYVKYVDDCGGGNGCWQVWKNNKAGFSSSQQSWTIPGSANAIRKIRDIRDEEGKARNTRSAMLDFNRDGFIDLAWANGGSELKIGANNGSGAFSLSSRNLPLSVAWFRDIKTVDYNSSGEPQNAPNVEQVFMDMNGDGLPDLVKSEGDTAWHVWRNTGSGFVDFGAWPVFHSNAWIEDFEKDDNDTEVMPMDMNGDGLTDIITGAASNWHVWFNTGSQFIDGGNWTPPAFGDDDLVDVDTTGNVRHELIDIDGDGLPDLVDPHDGSAEWSVYLNNGRGFAQPVQWWNPKTDGFTRDIEKETGNTKRDLLDIDGDGLVDVVTRTSDANWDIWPNAAGPEDLLSKITDTLGGTIQVSYSPSVKFSNTRLPFNYWLVTSLTTNNGVTGPHAVSATTGYSYAQGFYDFPTREFRGFGQVTETRADGSKVIHTYLQDEARKGKEASTETQNSANAKYALTSNSWSSGLVANVVYVSNLGITNQFTYDGTASNPKEVKKEFQNYDAYGNAGLEINHGDTAVSGDETYTYKEFVYNPALWIVDNLKHSYVSATAGGTKLRESWFRYDGAATIDTPPLKGNLTSEEYWLDTGTNPVTTYEYDSFGNRTKITDAENRASRMEYDTTFNTFPVKTWNAKNQLTVKEFNPANGEVTKETDPNQFVTSYVYDTFQRKTKEIKPYDSDAYPTTLIQYFLDGPAPKSVMVSKREIPGAAGTLDTVQFVDGFGNLIQTKSEYGSGLNRSAVDVYYDTMGRVAKQSNPYLVDPSQNYSTPDATKPAVSYRYDTMGRPILITNPDATTVKRLFDHWQVTETDENSHAKSYLFDAGQRLKQVVENNQGATYLTNYLYSPLGELKQITDHLQNITTIDYDSLGRKKAMKDPDLGSWSYGYDKAGNLTSQTDARGITTKIQYDELNRKALIDYPTSPDIRFTYDQAVKGTLSQVTDAAGTVTYSYDQRLRKTREDRMMDNQTFTTQWGYDSFDRITNQTYPDGQKVSFNYNSQGKLDNIPGIVTKLDYNPAGQTILKNYANGKSTSYTFDPVNQRLKGIQTVGAQNLSYSYDNVGNIKTIADGFGGMTETFGYDDLDRLTSAGDSGYSAGYQYNAIGNMLSSTKDGIQTTYTYGTNGVRPHAVIGMTASIPVIVTFDIDGGKPFTTTGQVTLDNMSYGSPTQYMASEDPLFSAATWQTYSANPTFALSSGFGTKEIYFRIRNANGLSEVKFAAIEFLADVDGDGIPDVYDEDNDNDGIPDTWENSYAVNPANSADPRRLNPLVMADGQLDHDGDGLTNYQEYLLGTNPWLTDSDKDDVNDYKELYVYHTNPNAIDIYRPSGSENFSIGRGNFNTGSGGRAASLTNVTDRIGNQFSGVLLTSAANLIVAPALLDFGVIAGSEKTLQLKLTNLGTQSVTVGTITMGGEDRYEFGQSSDACSNHAVVASGNCTINIVFMPTFTGAKNAYLTIPTNDPKSPSLLVNLSGIASNQTISSSKRMLSITTAGTGSGKVLCPAEQIVCNTSYQKQFDLGANLALHATADEYSLFDGWSGDCSGFGDCNLVMGTDKNITATFSKDMGRQVRVDGSQQSYFASILSAYVSAVQGDIIRAWGTDFTENVRLDQSKNIRLKGGYDAGFSSNTGMTRLHGSLTISKGCLTVDNLTILGAPHIPGDLNNDGRVDLLDFNILLSNYGQTNCGNIADINGDCVVNGADASILIANYGMSN